MKLRKRYGFAMVVYCVGYRQVDLFINGEYLGMYLLAEKVEVGENRVDIDEEKDVLYEKDNFATQEENFSFQTKHVNSKERGFRIHSPEDESSFSENKARIEWAEEVLYGINDAMFEQYFDLESWAKMYLLQLYTMNSDAYYGSFYFYYNHTDGKLYACSPWDFDWSLGVSWGNTDFYVNPMLYDIDHIEWIKPMLEHKNFIEAVLKVYYEDGVKEIIEGMPELVDKHGQENRASGLMNEIVNDIYCYPTDITDYDGSVAYVREVCVKRIEYVENKMEVYALLFGYNAN